MYKWQIVMDGFLYHFEIHLEIAMSEGIAHLISEAKR